MKVCTSVANVGFSKSRVSSNESDGSLIAQAVGLEADGPGAYESILTKLAKVPLRFLRTLLACLTIPCLASSEPGSFERKPLRPHIGCYYWERSKHAATTAVQTSKAVGVMLATTGKKCTGLRCNSQFKA